MLQPNLEHPNVLNQLNQMPFGYFAKDVNSVYTYVNQYVVNDTFAKTANDIIGKSDNMLPWHSAADQLVDYDKFAMRKGSLFEVDILTKFDGTKAPVLAQKAPIYDGNKITGVAGIAFILNINSYRNILNITSLAGIHFGNFLKTVKKRNPEFIYQNIEFSKRQAQIVGFILRGYTAELISQRLNLSKRTVESYIRAIKDKLRCDTKFELVTKAFDLGYIDLMFMVIE